MKSVTGRSIVPAAEYTNAASSGANDGERYCIVCGNKGTKVFATTMRNHVDVRYWSFIDDTYRFPPPLDAMWFITAMLQEFIF